MLEQLRAAGGDMGVRAGADRAGVVLHEHHRDQGHGQHDDGQIHGPADALERELGPAVAANRPHRQPEAGHQHHDQRDVVGHGGEAEQRHGQADPASAGGEDPQRLVAAQGLRQEQPNQAEAAEAEQDDARGERTQGVGDGREGIVAGPGVEVPADRGQDEQNQAGQQQL